MRCSAEQPPDLSRIRRTQVRPLGPEPSPLSTSPQNFDELMSERYGRDTFLRHERILRDERQRLWDNIREIAKVRYEHGLMPDWFKIEWLDKSEPPVNEFMRLHVQSEVYSENYKPEDKYQPLVGGDDGGSPPKGGDGWWWWWREDDPYWPLRDTGAHAMRWLTFAFAGFLAGGGLLRWVAQQDAEGFRTGFGTAALLSCCAMAMSDMTHAEYGAFAVKFAFMVCAVLAWRDIRARERRTGSWGLTMTSALSLGMCLGYLRTDMSGMEDLSIPNLQAYTSVLKIPSGQKGADSGEQVWVDFLGEKLRAYMGFRSERIKQMAIQPKVPFDAQKFLEARSAAGAAATAAAGAS